MNDLATRIDALLPQTQCTRCGYPSCRAYAEALADGSAPINRCPPGGEEGIRALAALLGCEALPLDPACGVEQPRRVAIVEESQCIGCTLCLQACPVEAIVGAAKRMHTVIAELCTGCELCLPACPTDCIAMTDPAPEHAGWDRERADAARERFERRRARLEREARERAARLAARALAERSDPDADRRRAIVQAAIERARARRAAWERERITRSEKAPPDGAGRTR